MRKKILQEPVSKPRSVARKGTAAKLRLVIEKGVARKRTQNNDGQREEDDHASGGG